MNERTWLTNHEKGRIKIISGAVIGRPLATSSYTVEDLEGMNLVGVYRLGEESPIVEYYDIWGDKLWGDKL